MYSSYIMNILFSKYVTIRIIRLIIGLKGSLYFLSINKHLFKSTCPQTAWESFYYNSLYNYTWKIIIFNDTLHFNLTNWSEGNAEVQRDCASIWMLSSAFLTFLHDYSREPLSHPALLGSFNSREVLKYLISFIHKLSPLSTILVPFLVDFFRNLWLHKI